MGDIIRPKFGRPQQTPPEGTGELPRTTTRVASLLRNSLPIHPAKLAEAPESTKSFLAGLSGVSMIELHLSGPNLDETAFLMYVPTGKNEPVFLPIAEFMDLLIGNSDDIRKSLEELIDFLEEIFQRIHILFEEVYFSPKEHMQQKIPGIWDASVLDDPIYIPGEYFYSIRTEDTEDEGMTQGPEIVMDLSRAITVTDLFASYFERTYEDSVKTYGKDTIVELMRYDYRTRQTVVIRVPYLIAEGACLTSILDRNILLQHLTDPREIIDIYLDRSLAGEVETSKVLDFSKK